MVISWIIEFLCKNREINRQKQIKLMRTMYLKTIKIISISLGFCLCLLTCTQPANNSKKVSKTIASTMTNIEVPEYPLTKRGDLVEDYHGTKVLDAYRWLEDDRSTETGNWVKAQNKATYGFIDRIPFRQKIQDRLEKLWSYERYSAPVKKKDYYYFFKNDGLQNQDVLYRQKGLEAAPEIVLDPNKFSSDGTTSLGGIKFSKDGKYLAYEVSEGGSDWQTIKVLDLETKKQGPDEVKWVKFSEITWQGYGFYYSRYPAPKKGEKLKGENQNHAIYFHEVGSSQAEDKPIYFDRSNPDRGFYTSITQDEKYLLLGAWESTSGNALYYKELESKKDEFIPIVDEIKDDFTFIDNLGSKLLVLTNNNAPNKRIVLIDTKKPEEKNWKDLIPESKHVIQSVDVLGGKLVLNYLENASNQIKIYDMEGKVLSHVKLPEIGKVQNVTGTKEDSNAFFAFESFTKPLSIYKLDLETGKVNLHKAPKIDFDSNKFETKQVWFTSKDGTKIPMFISHKKGLELDGNRPTLIYGYGGFDISILPGFNTTRLSLAPFMMENDGVFAVANIRGGGEFGSDWHKAGTKSKKQNVFNDFIAASEYLIKENYTSSEKLAAYGRSNGGLLIGAVMTQRPDLYKVALPAVGVLDMLRYEKFTIGWAWASDYGSNANAEDFKYLHAYSPLHNIEKQAYPATLVTTGDHDDRVVPAHSFKFISELQHQHTGETPVMIRVAIDAGHGAGKSTKEKINEASDILSFMFYNFGETPVVDKMKG